MSIFEKARALPEQKKKILFWSILIIFSALLLFFWTKRAKKKLEQFDVPLPSVPLPTLPFLKGTSLNDPYPFIPFPKLELEEDLKKLEELMGEEKQKDGEE